MTQIRHNLKVERPGENSGKGLKADGYPISNTSTTTEQEGQKGLPAVVPAITGSNGSKPEDSQVLSRAALQVHSRCRLSASYSPGCTAVSKFYSTESLWTGNAACILPGNKSFLSMAK